MDQTDGKNRSDSSFQGGLVVACKLLKAIYDEELLARMFGCIADQSSLPLDPSSMARRTQQFEPSLWIVWIEDWPCLGLVTFGAQLHDIANVFAGVVERGAFPARCIDIGIRIDVQIRGAFDPEEFSLIDRDAGPFGFDSVAEDHLASPIGRIDAIVELFGPTRFVQEQCPAPRAPAVVGKGRDDFIRKVDVLARVPMVIAAAEVMHADIPTPTVVGIVSCESSQEWVHGDFEDVAGSVAVEFHLSSVGADSHDAPTAKLQRSSIGTYGVHEPEIADCQVEPTVDSHRHSVAGVIRRSILETEGDILQENLLTIGNPIVVLIDKCAQMRWVQDVESIVIPYDASWGIDVIDVKVGGIGATIPVEILQPNDRASLEFAVEGPIFIARYKQGSIGCRGDEDGIVDRRWVGKKGRIETFGQFAFAEQFSLLFHFRVLDGDLLRRSAIDFDLAYGGPSPGGSSRAFDADKASHGRLDRMIG